jgi:hypothetical protein
VQPTRAVACAITFRSWPAGALHFKNLLPAAKASDINYADLAQSTSYSRLTLRNIGQLQGIFSRLINYLRANAVQPTNQGVGSSNLSGRAQIPKRNTNLDINHLALCLRRRTNAGVLRDGSAQTLSAAAIRFSSSACE